MRKLKGRVMKQQNKIACDILNEIFNVSIGKAADMLSQILHKTIRLRVPNVILLSGKERLSRKNKDSSLKLPDGTLMVSTISFSDALEGKANLVFPADKMHDFIYLCTGEQPVSFPNQSDFTDIDFDIINEIGNIVLNSIIGEMGNSLGITLSYSLPEVQIYNQSIDFSHDIESEECKSVLMLSVSFTIEQTEIKGTIFIDLTSASSEELFHLLSRIEGEFFG